MTWFAAGDGQHVYLHSVNARCIIHEYGSLEHGPQSITARIVAKDITFMTEVRERILCGPIFGQISSLFLLFSSF